MAESSAQQARVLAERVARVAQEHGVETALIGATALAVHNFVRATADVDLATYTNVFPQLRDLAEALRGMGLNADLRLPDEADPLGGVLAVWGQVDDEGEPLDTVEVVNFRNPYRANDGLALEAIRDAVALEPGSPLRCVRLPHLVALKLSAGSRRDLADVVDLLVRNPDADLDEIRSLATRFEGHEVVEQLIAEAAATRA